MGVLLALVAVVAAHVVLGAVLYRDVVRHGRSSWWLVAFYFATVPAAIAYLLLGRKERSRRVAN